MGLALKKPVKAAADSRMSVSPSVDGVTAVKTANNDSNNNKNTSVSPRSLQVSFLSHEIKAVFFIVLLTLVKCSFLIITVYTLGFFLNIVLLDFTM